MDYKTYQLTWQQQEEATVSGNNLPQLRLPAAAQQWDLRNGGHPTLTNPKPDFFTRPLLKDSKKPNVSLDLQTRPMGCVHGHNTLADINFTSLINVDVNIPTSPIFARDLAGRIIHLGLGPEVKGTQEWNAYDVDRNTGTEENPDFPNIHLASVTFPRHCQHVPEETPGYDILENVFFTKFRTLDVSFNFTAKASGDSENLNAGLYPNPHLYPYKTRLDTFYTDGYKLPQSQMLYARQDIPQPIAHKAAEKLMSTWENRPQDDLNNQQSYPEFLETLGGEDAIENLFTQGCTLIPTFEACNGINLVNRDFTLEDYHPGRAVYGLHSVIEERPATLPHGTILEVRKPGYVTATKVVPAEVVVSNGENYTTENIDDPEALIPNMKLPHQRCAADWGKCWLPTHPLHFEAPALWGWDPATGHFLQQSGPLWDPLHYHYSCTETIIRAFQNPLPQNRWLAEVPEDMHEKFHPIIPMNGFDTFDEPLLNQRLAEGLLPRTATKRVRRDLPATSGIGYHPLPLHFEYELDPFWFPELHPLNQAIEDCPEDLRSRLCPVIQAKIGVQDFINTIKTGQADWLSEESRYTPATGDVLEDYPFLMRYLVDELSEEDIFSLAAGVFLEDVEPELLEATPQQIWQGLDTFEDLEDMAEGLFDAVWDVREEQLKLLRLRHELYRQNPALYAYAWFICVPARAIEAFYRDWEEKQRKQGSEIPKNEIPLGSQVMPVSARDPDDATKTENPIDAIDVDRLMQQEETEESKSPVI